MGERGVLPPRGAGGGGWVLHRHPRTSPPAEASNLGARSNSGCKTIAGKWVAGCGRHEEMTQPRSPHQRGAPAPRTPDLPYGAGTTSRAPAPAPLPPAAVLDVSVSGGPRCHSPFLPTSLVKDVPGRGRNCSRAETDRSAAGAGGRRAAAGGGAAPAARWPQEHQGWRGEPRNSAEGRPGPRTAGEVLAGAGSE